MAGLRRGWRRLQPWRVPRRPTEVGGFSPRRRSWGQPARIAGVKPWLDKDGPLPKSHCMIPEAYRFALAWGINPFTGEPTPAGRWIIRNVVDWCRRNPTPGDDGDKFRRASSDIVVATLSPNRWWDGEPVRVPAGSDTHARTAKGVASRANTTPKADAGGNSEPGHTRHPTLGDGTRPLYDWWDLVLRPVPRSSLRGVAP